ncbi:MAG: SH3 domain-containing protein [Candidatus Obscuribacterales bacterium]
MRCPQCSQRNSVAARKCTVCGSKFARKALPKPFLFGAAGLGVVIAGSVLLSAIVPQMVDVEHKLGRVAKRVATGPRTTEEAKAMKQDLDETIKEFLLHNGDIKGGDLREKLKAALKRDAFEVHVIDLPRDLRIVEVDTLLQASPFLVMKGHSGTKVFRLNGLEVFDNARIINDAAGPVLVVLGHTGGQPPHHPQVRAYALLPDFIQEETDKAVPPLLAEGNVKFVSATSNDLNVEVSLPAALQQQGFFAANPTKDYIPLRQKFIWKDAHYTAVNETPDGHFGLLWNVAQVIRNPENAGTAAKSVIGDAGVSYAQGVATKAPFAFGKAVEDRNLKFTFVGDSKSIVFNFRRSRGGGGYKFTGGSTEPLTAETSNAVLQKAIAANRVSSATAAPPVVAAQPAAQAQVTTTASRAVTPILAAAAPPDTVPVAEIRVATSAFGNQNNVAPEAATTKTPGTVILPHAKNGGAAVEAAVLPVATPPAPKVVVAHNSAAVMAATLPPTATPPAVSAKKPASSGGGKTGRATMNRNIRNSPTSRSHSVGTMTVGSTVQVLGKSDGWYKIRVNGQEGYVYGGVSSSDVPEITASASRDDDNDDNNTRGSRRKSRAERRKERQAEREKIAAAAKAKKKARPASTEAYEDTGPVVINLDNPKNKVKIAHKKGSSAATPPEFVP